MRLEVVEFVFSFDAVVGEVKDSVLSLIIIAGNFMALSSLTV